jgi:hypothetical protein
MAMPRRGRPWRCPVKPWHRPDPLPLGPANGRGPPARHAAVILVDLSNVDIQDFLHLSLCSVKGLSEGRDDAGQRGQTVDGQPRGSRQRCPIGEAFWEIEDSQVAPITDVHAPERHATMTLR